MARDSKYDDLHDKYHTAVTKKQGDKYERLAALVLKILQEEALVIHDLKLTGSDPEVKHQIDVTVQYSDRVTRRLIIECKDFDISGKSVGIGVVRNFRSVIEDTSADEGIIVTCNGFTRQARKYAKSKEIKLCILRTFEESDMQNRIEKIVVRFVVQSTLIERANVLIDDENRTIFTNCLQSAGIGAGGVWIHDPVYFVRDQEKEQFCDFLSSRIHQSELWTITESGKLAMPPNGWRLQVESGPYIEFTGIVVDVRQEEEEETLEVASKRVAELILSGFRDADLVIFGDQLERYEIDPSSGRVDRISEVVE